MQSFKRASFKLWELVWDAKWWILAIALIFILGPIVVPPCPNR